MSIIPRVALRRFGSEVWNEIFLRAPRLELEVDNPSCLGTVLCILRRYQSQHSGAWFVVTIGTPTLLLIEQSKEQPHNPMTGKPCRIRVNAATTVDENGVVEELAQVAMTFPEHLTRAAFRAFLREQFGAHVLKHRRKLRALGLDYEAMRTLASGLFENSAASLEKQAIRVLGREQGEAFAGSPPP